MIHFVTGSTLPAGIHCGRPVHALRPLTLPMETVRYGSAGGHFRRTYSSIPQFPLPFNQNRKRNRRCRKKLPDVCRTFGRRTGMATILWLSRLSFRKADRQADRSSRSSKQTGRLNRRRTLVISVSCSAFPSFLVRFSRRQEKIFPASRIFRRPAIPPEVPEVSPPEHPQPSAA